MSKSDDGNEDDDGVLAPKVNTTPNVHKLNSGGLMSGTQGTGTMRSSMTGPDGVRESLWMSSYEGDRNLFSALGYITDPKYEHYRSRYERTDTAPALVDKLPKKAWSEPQIVDSESEGESNEFEKKVNQFLSGELTPENPIAVMERATRMERLGNFSLIFIGFGDDALKEPDADDAVGALKNEVDESSLESVDADEAIKYFTPYDQGRIDLEETDWADDDPLDPRFGKPESYHVDLGDNRPDAQIHYSRLIHVVGNVFDNDLESPSVLKQSLNRVDDIEKILGGSAEGFWRAAYQGLVISPPVIDGQQTEFSDSGDGLHQQIERYINNFSREIFTEADIDTIDANVEDPTGHLEAQYADLSAGHDIPQSILMGNETGERATEEDRRMWHERVSDFREEYCEVNVLRPVIDRLIEMNVLPEPEGGKGAYEVKWPTLDERSKQEEANIANTLAQAISTASGGNPELMVDQEEFRKKVLGWKAERGSEADVESDSMEPIDQDDLEVDEDNDRVQSQFNNMRVTIDGEEFERELVRVNKKPEEKDKVETADGRGVVVEILTDGFDEEGHSVEASEDNPAYVVVTESEDKPFGFYREDEIEINDWETDVESPESDLKEEEDEDRDNVIKARLERALAAFRGNQDGHFTWPESWREADAPARLIALDAWTSMGGNVSSCITEMRGDVVSPERFCADFADRLYQWDYWRGDSWAPGE